jgi:hypothetical protein
LKDGVINVNLVRKPGVMEDWDPPTQFADWAIDLNTWDQQWDPMDECDVDDHIIGLIMDLQYLLKKS